MSRFVKRRPGCWPLIVVPTLKSRRAGQHSLQPTAPVAIVRALRLKLDVRRP